MAGELLFTLLKAVNSEPCAISRKKSISIPAKVI
jgi:hypothetical protein